MLYYKHKETGDVYAYEQADIEAVNFIGSAELSLQEAKELLDSLPEPPEADKDGSASKDRYAGKRKKYSEAVASVEAAQSVLGNISPVFFTIRNNLQVLTEMTEGEVNAILNPPTPAIPVPTQVSRAQGKSALISSGLWGEVLSYVASIENPVDRALAEVAMNDTVLWKRDSPALKAISSALGMTEEEIDNLFTLASKIEV